jgi:hypothetical protein
MLSDVWDRLAALTSNGDDCNSVVYVYRLSANRTAIKPYALRTYLSEGFLTHLQRQLGGGQFKVLIRKDRKMIFSGDIALAPPFR